MKRLKAMSQLHTFDGWESLSSLPPKSAIVPLVLIDILASSLVVARKKKEARISIKKYGCCEVQWEENE